MRAVRLTLVAVSPLHFLKLFMHRKVHSSLQLPYVEPGHCSTAVGHISMLVVQIIRRWNVSNATVTSQSRGLSDQLANFSIGINLSKSFQMIDTALYFADLTLELLSYIPPAIIQNKLPLLLRFILITGSLLVLWLIIRTKALLIGYILFFWLLG